VPDRTTITFQAAPLARLLVTTVNESTAPAERIEYSIHACATATCQCCDVTLLQEANVAAANAHDAGRTPPVDLLFNVLTQGVRPAAESPSVAAERTAATIAAALPATIADQLVKIFFVTKARSFEDFDGTQSTTEFPFDEVEQHGTLVPLRQVIPFATNLEPPAVEGRDLSVDEQYCVAPWCNCSRTVVGIFELQPEHDGEKARESHRIVDFMVDWQRDQWSVAGDDRPLTPSEVSLRQALLAANSDLFAALQRRHRMMRTLYANSAAAAGRPAARPAIARRASKVGRNDPCPCGSGKKAKRCCQSTGGPHTDSP